MTNATPDTLSAVRDGAPRLTVSYIALAYGGRTVLQEISFAAGRGEILCLLGRSGSGKTTLLRLIAGLERPRGGRIDVDGRVLTGDGVHVPPEKRGVGLMFQDYALFPHLTALENARFAAKPGGPDPEDLLARVGLADAVGRYPHTLSAGEQQRVALARALAAGPTVLLMDEPFSNLDANTRKSIREMTLALLKDLGTTAVIVTHDSAEAMAVADRIVLLNDGRIEQVGTPSQLYRKPSTLYAARYFSELSPGGRPEAYVRPHDVCITAPGSGRPARVTALSFLGENTRVTLSAHDGVVMADLRGEVDLTPGQNVGVSCADNRLLFFPNP